LPTETLLESSSEPELRPIGQEAPVQSIEPENDISATVLPLDQPIPPQETSVTPGTVQGEEIPVASQTGPIEESTSTDEVSAPVQEEAPVARLAETNPSAPSGANLLSRLLDDEESFEQTMVPVAATAGMAAPVPPVTPGSANGPTQQSAVFSGNIDLDTLLHNGVVTDAGALTQLFRGGYRNRISKLAVSAKDLQNVPEEIRQVIKLTVVALSPIELSIARDLAMRLEAPGFVGESLLVAKKMACESYLTAYKNISKNYDDVSIVDTTSLKAPDISAESGEDLISFN
jgi:hypothetical protein